MPTSINIRYALDEFDFYIKVKEQELELLKPIYSFRFLVIDDDENYK